MKWNRILGSGFFAIILLVATHSCGGGGGGGGVSAKVTPADTATINDYTSIVITFDDAMDTATLVLAGTMAIESDGGIWSTATKTNDTLTISPISAWTRGEHTLIVDVNNTYGAILSTLTLNYTVDPSLTVNSVVPGNNSTIIGNDAIVITFNKTVDTTLLAASGSLWDDGDGGVWSSTTYADDTLTIAPAGLWPEGANDLTLDIADLTGNSLATLNLAYTVAAATCSDIIQNQDETGVDCGGSSCSACADGLACGVNADCSSDICTDNVCVENPDNDGDGSPASLDCDDADPTRYPGNSEICDGIDNDCDGMTVDDGVDEAWFNTPCDGDDSDLCAEGFSICTAGSPACSDITDDNEEICDGRDNNCDGVTDEGMASYDEPANCTAYTCAGVSGWLPSALPDTTLCRDVAGQCDVAEQCDGTATACPTDVFLTTVCRASTGLCDIEETCTGTNANCPVDAFQPADTSCDDGNACTGSEICDDAGVCLDGTPLDCNDGDACTGDSCDPATGCVNTAVVCDDGISCTADSCDSGSGICVAWPDDSVCDDFNICTVNTCEAATGCQTDNNVLDTMHCDDGDLATVNDQCTGGICGGTVCTVIELICDDGIDNDCDGLIDTDDIDCPPLPPLPPPP